MKRYSLALSFLVLSLFGLSALFPAAHAQFGGTEPLAAIVSPQYPRPYQTVTVIPQSSAFDLAAATVSISVNGTVVAQGSGAEPAYVTVGGPGTAATVTVRATTGGQTYTQTVVLRPADVALVLEPLSSAHPFYEGGVLVASEGRLRLVALPDLRRSSGVAVSASDLVYTWRNGEQILQSASGIGKSVLTASAPVRYRDATISVTVATQDQSVVAYAETPIAPSDPLVRIYRTDPLLGPLFSVALPTRIAMATDEESFRAVPYYFAGEPLVGWEVNSVPGGSENTITVRASGNGAGTALLTATARAPVSPSTATASLSVRFGEKRSFGLFGL